MRSYTIRNARAEFADVIGAAQYGGETIEITKHGKPVVRVIPANTSATTAEVSALGTDLAEAVDAYAASNGLGRNEAIAALLRAGLTAGTTQAAEGIEAVFPEVRELDAEAAHEAILEAETDAGESVLYDYDGSEVAYGYVQARGAWICTVSRKTDATDSLGLAVWEHTYEVCGSRGEAQARYRDAIITASANWRAGTDSMWFDATGPTFFEGFAHDRLIPLGAWGAECLAEA